jgi:DNA invertase Pin-like site-specific DNA recombinase
MGKTIAYLRASTDKQDIKNQQFEILAYANPHRITIDEWVEITISSRKTPKQRRLDEVLEKLADADTLIVTELSRLGRSMAEVVALVNRLMERKIRLIITKQGLRLDQHDMNSKVNIAIFSLLAELERDLISLRTKEALAAKRASGIKLGKPRGTIQASEFDKDRERIEELLKLGVSARRIAYGHLGKKSHSALTTYIKKRKLQRK